MENSFRESEILKYTQLEKNKNRDNCLLRALLNEYAENQSKIEKKNSAEIKERIYRAAGTMYVDETNYL
jgi:hypothetical protein